MKGNDYKKEVLKRIPEATFYRGKRDMKIMFQGTFIGKYSEKKEKNAIQVEKFIRNLEKNRDKILNGEARR